MKKFAAAALTIAIATGPASAVDVGVGGQVGGVGVSAGVSAGSQGASVGVGASADGLGGANVGASTSGSGSLGAGVSAGSNLGGVSAGVSTSIGAGDDPSADSRSASAPESPAAVTTAPASPKSTRQAIVLPPALRPTKAANGDFRRVTKGYPFGSWALLIAKPGTPVAVVRACRAAITTVAKPLGAVRVDVASAGPLRQRRGTLTAPITVRIAYARQGGIEVRQAHVGCRLNAAGTVTAVT
ncbi:hypothetical protein [Mesorhizobium sp. ORS 3428]|uniref:hypothetical protein n=1 Tax=Mesorhizobium sp. ORS 3428 TaxID=540997 RepID=UPI0008D9D0D8|nr:hypothetical protein [Mesorhizobium sp. ORS 3428]OHV88755.1 hypothetical protein ORS3428_18165 [Mesorhizobium sp. ORS 3428]